MLAAVNHRVAEIQNMLAKVGYPPINIVSLVSELKPGCAGLAYPLLNRIEISKHFLAEHKEETLRQTVAHEVCHLYVATYKPFAKQAHGPEFRSMMQSIGLNGKTYHSMKLENGPVKRRNNKTRFVYVTVNTKKEILLSPSQHAKALNGMIFTMKATGEKLVYSNQKKLIK